MTLKKLLWIDAFGALTAATVLLCFKKAFAPLFNLPEKVLTGMAITALCYAVYSFNLARQKSPSLLMTKILAIGNALYASIIFCFLFVFYQRITFLGVCYLLLDFVIVATFAYLESQQYLKHKKIE